MNTHDSPDNPRAADGEPSGPPPTWQPTPTKARSRRKLWVALAAASVLVIGGALVTVKTVSDNRTQAAAEREEARRDQQAAEQARDEEREREAEAAQYQQELAAFDTCTTQVNGLMEALDEADSRLDVGLSQSDLQSMIGDASVAYNQIDIEVLVGDCLSAAAKLESAFNNYATTVTDWDECIFDTYCDIDTDVLPQMQEKWSKASDQIDAAHDLVDGLDPDRAGGGLGQDDPGTA